MHVIHLYSVFKDRDLSGYSAGSLVIIIAVGLFPGGKGYFGNLRVDGLFV